MLNIYDDYIKNEIILHNFDYESPTVTTVDEIIFHIDRTYPELIEDMDYYEKYQYILKLCEDIKEENIFKKKKKIEEDEEQEAFANFMVFDIFEQLDN